MEKFKFSFTTGLFVGLASAHLPALIATKSEFLTFAAATWDDDQFWRWATVIAAILLPGLDYLSWCYRPKSFDRVFQERS